MASTVLLTGGSGYIGSHVGVELLDAGHRVVILDDLSNSSSAVVDRIRAISPGDISFYEGSLSDTGRIRAIVARERVDAVVHLAGLKIVADSVRSPLVYYDTNVGGTISLVRALDDCGVRNVVFSSSCTVYGDAPVMPVRETHPLQPTNPYGRTKALIEKLLEDVVASSGTWCVTVLRYFNPVGAHPSGLIGEDPRGVPANLMPIVMDVACGRRERVSVYGGDYPSADGTCVRDYLHVVDLARGHVAALDAIRDERYRVLNLGTGRGHSVLEVLQTASAVTGERIPHELVGRRPGDAAVVWADATRAREVLGWSASRSLEDMCGDAWRWHSSTFAPPAGTRAASGSSAS